MVRAGPAWTDYGRRWSAEAGFEWVAPPVPAGMPVVQVYWPLDDAARVLLQDTGLGHNFAWRDAQNPSMPPWRPRRHVRRWRVRTVRGSRSARGRAHVPHTPALRTYEAHRGVGRRAGSVACCALGPIRFVRGLPVRVLRCSA